MDNRFDIRASTVDLAVNEAFQIHRPAGVIDRTAAKVVFHQIVESHELCGS